MRSHSQTCPIDFDSFQQSPTMVGCLKDTSLFCNARLPERRGLICKRAQLISTRFRNHQQWSAPLKHMVSFAMAGSLQISCLFCRTALTGRRLFSKNKGLPFRAPTNHRQRRVEVSQR
mmetsp:Transcript_59730/g.96739  ORF Transcript_59730/g.96739 Transcript_59730/m.96739 type:complete len:118 (+) Transcript_59730:366-719(+)